MLHDIVVVDDDLVSLTAVTHVLTSAGIGKIHQISKASEMMYLLATDYNPDLFIVDLYMPAVDGDQLIGKMRSAGFKRVPVIFISADNSEATRKRLKKVKRSQFLHKEELSKLPMLVKEILAPLDADT